MAKKPTQPAAVAEPKPPKVTAPTPDLPLHKRPDVVEELSRAFCSADGKSPDRYTLGTINWRHYEQAAQQFLIGAQFVASFVDGDQG